MQGNGHLFTLHNPVELKTLASHFFNCAEYQQSKQHHFLQNGKLKSISYFPLTEKRFLKEFIFQEQEAPRTAQL